MNSAILCNDPHLIINTPNIWYENHLEAPGYKNTGVSIAGAPLVLIGHNDKIAWGATLSYADIQDTYIEKFTASGYSQYKHKDRILKAKIREEAIYIKKQKEPNFHKVRETIHGPVLLYLEDNKGLTLQSRGLQENNGILGFYELRTCEVV